MCRASAHPLSWMCARKRSCRRTPCTSAADSKRIWGGPATFKRVKWSGNIRPVAASGVLRRGRCRALASVHKRPLTVTSRVGATSHQAGRPRSCECLGKRRCERTRGAPRREHSQAFQGIVKSKVGAPYVVCAEDGRLTNSTYSTTKPDFIHNRYGNTNCMTPHLQPSCVQTQRHIHTHV